MCLHTKINEALTVAATMSSFKDTGRTAVGESELLAAVQKLSSADGQRALVRVYACAALFHAPQSDDVAEARAGEEAAMQAMERIAMGRSADQASDLAAADAWAGWHARRVRAEAQMESKIAATVAHVMRRAFGSSASTQARSNTEDSTAAEAATTTTASSAVAAPLLGLEAAVQTATPNAAAARKEASTGRQTHDAGELLVNIVGGPFNTEDHNRMNIAAAAAVAPAAGDAEADDNDAPAAEDASTRTPSPQEAGHDRHADLDEAPLSLSTESLAEEERSPSLSFPKLAPPTMSIADIAPSAAPLTGEEAAAHAPRRLSYEDYGLQFTQADFDVACEEVRRQRGGAAAKSPDVGAAAAAAASAVGASGRPSALLGLTNSRLGVERVPPPPRQVEDAGLHYVRRQLPVRHLRPYVSPLKALMFRLAEGDSTIVTCSTNLRGSEDGAAPHLSDPLMARLAAELREVCLLHPVPRVRVRPDAQVYRRDRGYFKADEVRVQLHVEVVPVSGPMAGEAIHVWVRIPAGYPFVAPRAHLTVELPHRRCTGVAVDKVPHLIALSFDAALAATSAVCPAPAHDDEAAQLRPLEGPVNSGWRSSLTLRHVLTTLADLFNAGEFSETARELQNENLMHNGLQRARVNMYEEEGDAAREAMAATKQAAAAQRSATRHPSCSNDDDDTTGEDSMGITINAEEDVAPSYLLLCNGPFLTKPTVAPSSPTTATRASTSVLFSAEASAERQGDADVDDDEGSVHTADSTPTRRNAAARRRQRKPLTYHEMESDRLSGPWRGCWGHVLYSPSSAVGATPATNTGVTTSVSSPIRLIAGAGETSAFAKSPRSPAGHLAPRSLTFSPLPLLPSHSDGDGALYIRLKHHNAEAAAATVRLVRIPSSTLRDQGGASVVNTPLRRARGRLSPQSTWLNTALGTSFASAPPGTAWASAPPAEMDMDVLICVHDDDEHRVGKPSDLAATLPRPCQRQHVSLHDLRATSVEASSTASSNHVAFVTSAIALPGSLTTAETSSACVSETSPREEDSNVCGGNERCYAVVIDVPEGQEVSVVFSSDEAVCLAMPWSPAAESLASTSSSQSTSDAASLIASPSQIRASAVTAAAQLDVDIGISSHAAARGGVLVELPYDAWQFHAAPASAAVASGASRDEDIHPHWPRNARFHEGQRVVPLTLKETTFRMYQLLQNTQVGSRSNAHTGSYLAAAPFSRVRQAYAATRTSKEQEAMVRRYGFWGWRNILLPILSPETRDLVHGALQAEDSAAGETPGRSTATSAKMLAKALTAWEAAAVEDFGAACVQLHRDPDASMAYRAPFRSFAVLRTLALTVAYALEVMQSADQASSRTTAAAEAAALQECLNQVLWSATVLAVVTAAVKPAFLEVCASLADAVKGKDASCPADASCAGHCEREVQQALSQMTDLQRSAARVLAATTISAFPKEVAALVSASATGDDVVAARTMLPSPSVASLTDQVTQLFNAPATPLLGHGTMEDYGVAMRVGGLVRLVRPS